MAISTNTIEVNPLQKDQKQQKKMETYYSFQSKIYDLTRWSFLFGRKNLIYSIPAIEPDSTIMEIGCGTGYNLQGILKQFPDSNVIGVDISKFMVEKARKKIKHSNILLINEPYGLETIAHHKKVDVIVFSYALSMINPYWSNLLDQAKEDLKPGGYIAVVDFEYSRFNWFRKHMSNHHVRMEKHLTPYLEQHFQTVINESKAAYGGVWNFFTYIGQKSH